MVPDLARTCQHDRRFQVGPICQQIRTVPIKSKLTKAEITALVNVTHHEPRSLLGYHEYPAGDGHAAVRGARARAGRRDHRGVLGRHAQRAASAQDASTTPVCSKAAFRSAARWCRTGCACAFRSITWWSNTTPISSRTSSRTSTSIYSAKAGTTACTTSSARTCACATASPAPTSPSGRRTPGA